MTEKKTSRTTSRSSKTATGKATAATGKTTPRARTAAARKKSTRASKDSIPLQSVSAEELQSMIAESAYYIAEKHGFDGNPEQHWLEAEQEICSRFAA